MKEFINKLIGRLEELKKDVVDSECPVEKNSRECEMEYACETCYLTKTINIVNELAEEYINTSTDTSSGWITCSERLPEKEVDVLVCFSNDMDCVIAYRTKMMNTNLKDVWVNSSTAQIISSNITAWQPLPQPYQEEGE